MKKVYQESSDKDQRESKVIGNSGLSENIQIHLNTLLMIIAGCCKSICNSLFLITIILLKLMEEYDLNFHITKTVANMYPTEDDIEAPVIPIRGSKIIFRTIIMAAEINEE